MNLQSFLSDEPSLSLTVRVVEINKELIDSFSRLIMHGFMDFPHCCICKRKLKLLRESGEVVPNNFMIPKLTKSFICPSDAEYLFCLSNEEFKDYDSPLVPLSKVVKNAKSPNPSKDDVTKQ